MELTLNRQPSMNDTTLGHLWVDGKLQCFTLEDMVRKDGTKVYGETAIPAGTYPVTISWSPRFGRDMPSVDNVPGFEGIRIHVGNTAEDTLGCILVGKGVSSARMITQSTAAFSELYAILERGCKSPDGVTIKIIDA